MKLTCFSLLYVESDFGTTEPQPTNHSQCSSPVEVLNLIVNSKSQPVDLDTVNSLVSGHPRELKNVSVSRAVRLRELFP